MNEDGLLKWIIQGDLHLWHVQIFENHRAHFEVYKAVSGKFRYSFSPEVQWRFLSKEYSDPIYETAEEAKAAAVERLKTYLRPVVDLYDNLAGGPKLRLNMRDLPRWEMQDPTAFARTREDELE